MFKSGDLWSFDGYREVITLENKEYSFGCIKSYSVEEKKIISCHMTRFFPSAKDRGISTEYRIKEGKELELINILYGLEVE